MTKAVFVTMYVLALFGLWKIYDLLCLWYMITQMRGGL